MALTKPQTEVIYDKSRFRVLITGRRFGKTFLAINELAKFASKPNQKVWYVAQLTDKQKQYVGMY